MNKELKENIIKLLEYSQDEDTHFWANCQCSEDIQEKEDFKRCNCEENKTHIYRTIIKIGELLEDEENEEQKQTDKNITKILKDLK